ncbi:FLA10 [Symbiodinium sp. CCMP2592]|nr:FLA10 [Symbiodinium sp. CCMP2592]
MGSIDVAGDGEEDSHWLRGLRSRRLSQPDSPGSAEAEEEGSSPDLEALRARQQRLRELKAGLAAAHLEDEEEEEELEEEDDPEEEEEDEVTSDSPESLSGPSQASVGQVNSGSAPVGVLVRCRPLLKEGSRIKLSASSAKSGKVMLRLQPEEQSRSRQSEPKVFRCNGFISEEGTQADVFEHVAPVVDRVMEGYNGVVFCYGITGSGKTHTMSGPPKEPLAKQVKDPAPPEVIAAQQGIVQRAAKRIFEFIRDRSARGEMFTVEASFLEIYSPDGARENLIDLLANKADEAKLEVKQDALVGHKAFMCEGLKSVPIRSPDEMRQVLEGGRRRCTYMETSRNCVSSRSHCLFTVVIESTSSSSIRDTDPDVRRGKLVLVDLAGSESLKKVMAVQEANEELRRKQAIGINKVLTHLGAVVNNLNAGYENSTGFRNSALTMLLRDCLGGGARALLVANIGPEADWSSETAMTLRFAQKMMKVKNVEQKVVIDASQSLGSMLC